MRPVAIGSQFVEGDVTNEGVAPVIVGCGNIPGNAIAGGLHARSYLPAMAGVKGIGCVRIVLVYRQHLLRIVGIDGDPRTTSKLGFFLPRAGANSQRVRGAAFSRSS